MGGSTSDRCLLEAERVILQAISRRRRSPERHIADYSLCSTVLSPAEVYHAQRGMAFSSSTTWQAQESEWAMALQIAALELIALILNRWLKARAHLCISIWKSTCKQK